MVVVLARSPNEKKEKAHELYNSGMKLVEIASQLDCSAATIRTWKNRYKWDEDENETFQKKSETKRNVSKKKIKTVSGIAKPPSIIMAGKKLLFP